MRSKQENAAKASSDYADFLVAQNSGWTRFYRCAVAALLVLSKLDGMLLLLWLLVPAVRFGVITKKLLALGSVFAIESASPTPQSRGESHLRFRRRRRDQRPPAQPARHL
jgi:hypothetical protein